MKLIGPSYSVPANSSRFFNSQDIASAQPLGNIQLTRDSSNSLIYNLDYSSMLIHYDQQYCTSMSAMGESYMIPTLDYLGKVLSHLPEGAKVIDIGCGQGEFVNELRSMGIEAFGYDPVLRRQSPYLFPFYWTNEAQNANLYVMRCVLPHISNPWDFLSGIAKSAPGSLVLIEFQRLEWIVENSVWYQISHDHVNLFCENDFRMRYEVIESGTFSSGEWCWVLLDPSKVKVVQEMVPAMEDSKIESLFEIKEKMLQNIKRLGRPVAIWGASGKGIVLAHTLNQFLPDLIAVDADQHRWGLHLEASGVKVLSPRQATDELSSETLILVCNPNHMEQVKDFIRGRKEVTLPLCLS